MSKSQLRWIFKVNGSQWNLLGVFLGTLPSFMQDYWLERHADCLQINLTTSKHPPAFSELMPHCVQHHHGQKWWKRNGTTPRLLRFTCTAFQHAKSQRPWPHHSASGPYHQRKSTCTAVPCKRRTRSSDVTRRQHCSVACWFQFCASLLIKNYFQICLALLQ